MAYSSVRAIKKRQHKLYYARVLDVQNGRRPGKPVQANSMFKSVNDKPKSIFNFSFV